jgi:hypothetical protein
VSGGVDLLGWTDEAFAAVERQRGWTEAAIERLDLTWDARSGRVGIPVRDATCGCNQGGLLANGRRHPGYLVQASRC